jgi:hypothetical protein
MGTAFNTLVPLGETNALLLVRLLAVVAVVVAIELPNEDKSGCCSSVDEDEDDEMRHLFDMPSVKVGDTTAPIPTYDIPLKAGSL